MGITIPSRTSPTFGPLPPSNFSSSILYLDSSAIPLVYCLAYQTRRSSLILVDGCSIFNDKPIRNRLIENAYLRWRVGRNATETPTIITVAFASDERNIGSGKQTADKHQECFRARRLVWRRPSGQIPGREEPPTSCVPNVDTHDGVVLGPGWGRSRPFGFTFLSVALAMIMVN